MFGQRNAVGEGGRRGVAMQPDMPHLAQQQPQLEAECDAECGQKNALK
jgi:hypothetical protein